MRVLIIVVILAALGLGAYFLSQGAPGEREDTARAPEAAVEEAEGEAEGKAEVVADDTAETAETAEEAMTAVEDAVEETTNRRRGGRGKRRRCRDRGRRRSRRRSERHARASDRGCGRDGRGRSRCGLGGRRRRGQRRPRGRDGGAGGVAASAGRSDARRVRRRHRDRGHRRLGGVRDDEARGACRPGKGAGHSRNDARGDRTGAQHSRAGIARDGLQKGKAPAADRAGGFGKGRSRPAGRDPSRETPFPPRIRRAANWHLRAAPPPPASP